MASRLNSPARLQATCIIQVVYNIGKLGAHGVDLFFVLSGYLITGILLDTKGSANYFRTFYLRRSLRIFPLYYLFLAFSFFVVPALAAALPSMGAKLWRFAATQNDWPWYVFYLSNFLIARTNEFTNPTLFVTWSLAIEEQFYLAWAVIVFHMSRERLKTFALIVGTGSLLLRCVLQGSGVATWYQGYTWTWCRMDTLCMGAFIAAAVRTPGFRPQRWLPMARRVATAASAMALIAYAAWLIRFPPAKYLTWCLVTAACGAWLYVALFEDPSSPARRVLGSGALRFFGKYSYAIYLFHPPVRGVLRDVVFRHPLVTDVLGTGLLWQTAFYVAATLAVVPVALLSWNLLERPILSWKDRIARYSYTARASANGAP